MLKLTLDVRKRSSWFWTKQSLEITAEFSPLESFPCMSLVERMFRIEPNFIPEIAFRPKGSRLTDLRGRPRESFNTNERDDGNPHDEELFYARGVLFDVEEFNSPVTGDSAELPEIPFTYRISTHFESFVDGAHIEHKTLQNASPILDDVLSGLSGSFFSRLFPARIEKLRLGMEAYEPKLSGSIFGMMPVIQDRLYLEFSPSRIQLRASSEGRRERRLPFADRQLLDTFGRALKELGLYPNFNEELLARL